MPRAGLTHDRVVAAAADLADEVGFAHVTPSELARRLGVRVPSLYSHVDGADGLRTGVALLALSDLAERCDAALVGTCGRAAVAALGNVFRDYAAEYPGRYDAARHPLSPEDAAASAGPRISTATRDALDDYDLTDDDRTHAVRLLGSVFHGFTSLERTGGFSHSSPDSQVTWERVLDGLDAMFRSWKDPR